MSQSIKQMTVASIFLFFMWHCNNCYYYNKIGKTVRRMWWREWKTACLESCLFNNAKQNDWHKVHYFIDFLTIWLTGMAQPTNPNFLYACSDYRYSKMAYWFRQTVCHLICTVSLMAQNLFCHAHANKSTSCECHVRNKQSTQNVLK